MKLTPSSRRKFLAAGSALAAVPCLNGEDITGSPTGIAAAKEFLSNWDAAWNNHDAHKLSLLHTPDVNTVNRFGTLLRGREALEKALGFLHGVSGPFHDVTTPPLKLMDTRQIAADVIILQASWKNPVMNPDGKIDPAKQNDMIVSYTLLRSNGTWKATQVDLHNIEKMNLPFSNAAQKS